MKEFIIAVLPYAIIGISIAIICTNSKKKDYNYIMEGMLFGLSLGASFSTTLKIDIGLGMTIGMLIGEAIGSFIKKEKDE